MTLHPLASKGGAFVLKLGLVFKRKSSTERLGFFLLAEKQRRDSNDFKCDSPAFVKDIFPFSCNLNTPMI